ncbi:transketolase [Catellicoccus marimammalium]|uniref:Transketolase n=1 Tax=Catellicoccus marimammalium M35/04/3 TaxID=1234409 RepID=K8ZQ20_9ENTE|nr:transketolase [Catellicoccus marimammalium]EKU27676.1 Transketolase [Catellicoccus marimammalium M35/04/3]
MFDKIDELCVNATRVLSVEAIQQAKSGHPGLPLGAAPMAYVLWSRFLNVNPATSRKWINRDRFVLSAGHGSALLYSLLHLSGYDVSIKDLKNFRQLNSKTPGHPEVNHTDGVEATTGPLGQGVAMATGMAMAEAHLAAQYNREGFPIIDHYTYALCGDGDLMEGISQEAISLAGQLKLGKLIFLYDSNDISLDGPLCKANTESAKERFEASNWHYVRVENGNDLEEIAQAIEVAKAETTKPSLIEIKTTIGFGAPNEGTNKVHGAPLGEEGIESLKERLNYPYPEFTVPEEVQRRYYETIGVRGAELEQKWNELFDGYQAHYPDLAKELIAGFKNEVPFDLTEKLPHYSVEDDAKASRVTSQNAIQTLSKEIPSFWGGSADLSASNNTMAKAEEDFEAGNYSGRNIWFGVREFGMAAMMNGIALHGGTKVYGGTFFVFVDYLRPAIRLAALQGCPVTYVLTHDSIAVGEDGPTHEPIEQLASLRAMPNLNVIRPADGNETSAAWEIAVRSENRPTALVLSRQNLPVIAGTEEKAFTEVKKGAYVVSPAQKEEADGIFIATGSEVNLALQAQAMLREEGIDYSVVSMPSMNLFEEQSLEYKESVLPSHITKRISIEMGSTFGWERYVGSNGRMIGIDRFGASGKGNEVLKEFGFTPEEVVAIAKQLEK